MIVELFMLLISGSAYSDYEVPQITPKPREYSDKPKLIRSLKRQCCLQVFLSLIAILAVVISSILLFVEGKEIYEWTMINESMIIYLLQINVVFSIRLPDAPGCMESVVRMHQDLWRRISTEIQAMSPIQNIPGDNSQTLLSIHWGDCGNKVLQRWNLYQIPPPTRWEKYWYWRGRWRWRRFWLTDDCVTELQHKRNILNVVINISWCYISVAYHMMCSSMQYNYNYTNISFL